MNDYIRSGRKLPPGAIRSASVMLCCVAAATGMGLLFVRLHFPETNVVVVYILSVLLTSRLTRGYFYGIAAAVAATCAFNYFFTDPYFTLSVNDPTYFITFAIMTLTAVITGALTSTVKQKALEAQEKEAEASALYRLTARLTGASDLSDITDISVNAVNELMDCSAECICFDSCEQAADGTEDPAEIRRRLQGRKNGPVAGPDFWDWPVSGRDAVLGVIRVPTACSKRMNASQLRLLRSMTETIAMAMDRFFSARERLRSREEVARERYRGTLLRAISHDLRTPLSGIMGTSEMLMDMTDKRDERYALAEGIYKDADWLHSLVENILNLTRLQDGKLAIRKEPEAVEEVLGAAVGAIGKRAPEHEITVCIPDEVLLVPMDARLIGQVLVNLLDNAVKHTPPEKEIRVSVNMDTDNKLARFTVSDRGAGIAAEDLPHIFQMFYTTQGKGPDAQRGVGLGLAICESIISAHGGTITANNREDGPGAEFLFTLPAEDNSNA